MPDHAHWLIRLNAQASLSPCIARMKAVRARAVNRLTNSSAPLWQKGYYDHCLRSDESVEQVANYIVANPLRAGLVDSLGDYPFWNAAWLK
jgi:putative transposase